MGAVRVNPVEYTEWNQVASDGRIWVIRHLVDGRVEMRSDVVKDKLDYVAWGSLFEAKIMDDIPYPRTFATSPSIRVEPYSVRFAGICGIEFTNRTNNTTHFPAIYALRPTTAIEASIAVTVIATGRLV